MFSEFTAEFLLGRSVCSQHGVTYSSFSSKMDPSPFYFLTEGFVHSVLLYSVVVAAWELFFVVLWCFLGGMGRQLGA